MLVVGNLEKTVIVTPISYEEANTNTSLDVMSKGSLKKQEGYEQKITSMSPEASQGKNFTNEIIHIIEPPQSPVKQTSISCMRITKEQGQK